MSGPGLQIWTVEQSNALRNHIAAGMSYSQAAARINFDFGTNYSRNAAIGRANRIGVSPPARLSTPKKPRVYKKREHKPKVRIVAANSNSNQFRVIQVSETSLAELRCAEVTPRGLTLSDLRKNDCRYPYGDSDFTFCGHPKLEGSSYCPEHFALTRPLPSERRATPRIPTPATWRAA